MVESANFPVSLFVVQPAMHVFPRRAPAGAPVCWRLATPARFAFLQVPSNFHDTSVAVLWGVGLAMDVSCLVTGNTTGPCCTREGTMCCVQVPADSRREKRLWCGRALGKALYARS